MRHALVSILMERAFHYGPESEHGYALGIARQLRRCANCRVPCRILPE